MIVSPQHQRILVPRTPEINALFSHVPTLDGQAVIPHDVAETIMLRKLGFRVPSPLAYYDWCGGTPFDIQRATCDLLTMNERAYVLNDMGTGKTKAALWAWHYLYQRKRAGKLLVIAPLSTLSFVWLREIVATVPGTWVEILHHTSRSKRLERLANRDAHIYILNHDGLDVLGEELQRRPDIDTFVIDELAVFRNARTQRSRILKALSNTRRNVWGMTGSPMPNSPTDVWGQARIVTPKRVPQFFSHFRDMVMLRESQYLWVPKPTAVDTAFKVLQPSVRFTLDDVMELPDVIQRDIEVEMSPEQQKVYAQLAAHYHAQATSGTEITAANAGACMQKLLQVASGWVYGTDGSTVDLHNDARIKAVVDVIAASSRKVIVFATFLHAVDGLSRALKKEGINHKVITGEVGNRDEIFNEFQNGSHTKVLVAHPRCMAHGLTLTAADTIIWFLPTTSLEIYEQADARIRRVGQQHKQQIIHLVGTKVEKRIYSSLRRKQRVQDELKDLLADATVMLEYQ